MEMQEAYARADLKRLQARIEELEKQLEEVDAVVFLIDANVRGPGSFPIPLGTVRAAIDRVVKRAEKSDENRST